MVTGYGEWRIGMEGWRLAALKVFNGWMTVRLHDTPKLTFKVSGEMRSFHKKGTLE
jgi:hypothetical protein